MTDHTDVPDDEPPAKDNSRWSVAKVPATIVVVAALQLGSALWWSGGVTTELGDHARRITALELSVVQLQAQLNQIAISVAGVGQKVDGIGRQIDQLQDRLPLRK